MRLKLNFEAHFFCRNFTLYIFMKHRKYLLAGMLSLSLIWACGNNANQSSTATAGGDQTEMLFASKCSMCHDFKEDKIGPSLAGVQQRWGNDPQRLKSFIRNSKEMINSGDPYATALYEKWHRSDMPSFPDLTEAELDALIVYLK